MLCLKPFESWRLPYSAKLVAFDNPDHGKANMRKKVAFNPLDYYKRYLFSTT